MSSRVVLFIAKDSKASEAAKALEALPFLREHQGPPMTGKHIVSARLVCLGIWLIFSGCDRARPSIPSPGVSPASANTEAPSEQVHQLCGACHRFPPPDSFPRSAWKDQVQQAYEFFKHPPRNNPPVLNRLTIPPQEQVLAYFENRAPEALPVLASVTPSTPAPVAFERVPLTDPMRPLRPAISNVNLVHLADPRKLDLLVCDMRYGRVMALKPYDPSPTWQILGEVSHPAHAEVVDLDGDGIPDILVADLGSFRPTEAHCGSVIWLRGDAAGNFTPIPLLQGVGRVADVQAADFRGIGKLDLVVAVFGLRQTGEILSLATRTTDWSHPVFQPHVLDDRTGGIHVPVTDLNGDGRPDFVALISQEHETVVAFLNEGVAGAESSKPRFRKEIIYEA